MRRNIIILLVILAGITKTYAQAPKVASFSPSGGPIGTAVIIKGSGFSAIIDSNVVNFGATPAKITAATATQLTVTVPAGATFTPFTVSNKSTRLIGHSILAFNTSFSPANTDLDTKVRFQADTGASAVQIADMDGDGKTDIIAIDPIRKLLMVSLNKSTVGAITNKSFAGPVVYATGAPQSGFASVDDMDGDGKPDIVLMNIGYTTIPNGKNYLTFYHNSSIAGKIKLIPLTVTGTSASGYNFLLKPGDNVAKFTDVDGDGKPDLVVLNTAGYVSVYLNTYVTRHPLTASFGPPVTFAVGANPNSFNIGDMDGDGKPDIFVTNYSGLSLSILRNNSTTGSITASSFQINPVPLGYSPLTTTLGDLDGDGKLDVLIGSAFNIPTVMIHSTSLPGSISGGGVIFSSLNISANFNNELVLQDINGDGKPDMLSLSADLTKVYLYTNKSTPGQTSTAYFNDQVIYPITTIPDAVADLDGDGRPDIIVASRFGIDIYHSKAAPVQTATVPPIVSTASVPSLLVYPNPATTSTTVQYNLTTPSSVQISIYDVNGMMVASSNTPGQTAGSHTAVISTANLQPGMYVVSIVAGTLNKASKLMIL